MPYIEGRVVHDADAHVMETPDWLLRCADPSIRDRIPQLHLATTKPGEERLIAHFTRKHRDPAYRAHDAEEIMLRKNWAATGSFLKEDRPQALDLLGVASQLVFNTFLNGLFARIDHGGDLDLAYGVARAHNRAMTEFCAVDRRLLATGYVPLADFERARSMAAEATIESRLSPALLFCLTRVNRRAATIARQTHFCFPAPPALPSARVSRSQT